MNLETNLKTLKGVDVKGKRVIVRCDFDVPIKGGLVADDTRIRRSLETIRCLLRGEAERLILVAHRDRPGGKKIKELSLSPVAKRLAELLGQKSLPLKEKYQHFEAFRIDPRVVLLENIRFYPQEEKNNPNFSKRLALLGDIFVMEAFATAHRKHSSTFGIASYLPTVAGLNFASEISHLERISKDPQSPFVVIMAGAKVKEKIGVISNLLSKLDYLLLGGGIATTFLAALGCRMCNSLVDFDSLPLAQSLLAKYKKKIFLPLDLKLAKKIEPKAKIIIKEVSFPGNFCRAPYFVVDIGPKTIKKFSQIIRKAQTLLWNGPLGIYEIPRFAQGTRAIGKVFEEVASGKPYGLVGGGDVVGALEKSGYIKRIDYISTGGGAMLAFLAGQRLPGLEITKVN